MDPNANLQEQERIMRDRYYPMLMAGERSRLRELRNALNAWIASGGFEPDWSKAPNAARYYGH